MKINRDCKPRLFNNIKMKTEDTKTKTLSIVSKFTKNVGPDLEPSL